MAKQPSPQESSILLERLRISIAERYPTIIAQSFNYFMKQSDPILRTQALVQGVFQHTMKYLALMALSEYCNQDVADPAVNDAVMKLQRPQYGHWVELLRGCDAFLAKHPPVLVTELTTLFSPKRHPKLKVASLFDKILAIKNKSISHGGGPQQAEREAAETLNGVLSQILLWLEELEWISDYPLFALGPDQRLWRLMGNSPSEAVAAMHGTSTANLFFHRHGRSLTAFPFFFLLQAQEPEPRMFLYEGATGKLIVYLSNIKFHLEKDPKVVELLRELLNRKAIQLREIAGELTGESIFEACRSKVLAKLPSLECEGRWSGELYVSRQDLDGAFQYWNESDRSGLMIVGEAGSGKSMNMYAWAKRLINSGSPTLLLEGKEIVDATLPGLKEKLCWDFGRPETLDRVLDVVKESGKQFILLLDAVEECPDSQTLLLTVLALLQKYDSSSLRVVMSLRDVAFERLTKKEIGDAIFALRDRFAQYPGDKKDAPSRPYYLLKRLAENDTDAFFTRYREHFHITTTKNELDDITAATLRNPLLLRLACEAFRDCRMPALISPHRLFSIFLERKLRNPVTGRLDVECGRFLNRFAALAFTARSSQLDYDALLNDPMTTMDMVVKGSESAYDRLLQAGVLVEVIEENCTRTTSWVRTAFDSLLEVLLLGHFRNLRPIDLAALMKEKPLFQPLAGVLSLALLRAAEKKNPQAFMEIVPDLGDKDIQSAMAKALQNLCYTAPDEVPSLVRSLADTATPAALDCVTDLFDFCYAAGLWDMARGIYKSILDSKSMNRPELEPSLIKFKLDYCELLFSMGNFKESKKIALHYLEYPDHSIVARAWVSSILAAEELEKKKTVYMELVEKCRCWAETTNDTGMQAFAIWALGSYLETRFGNYRGALAEYNRAFALEEDLRHRGQTLDMRPYADDLAELHNWYGRALAYIPGRAMEAESRFLHALELHKKARRLFMISVSWNNLSAYYLDRGMLEKALQFCDLEFSQCHLFQNDPEWAFSFFNRCAIMLHLALAQRGQDEKHLAEADRCAKESIRIGEKKDEKNGEGHQDYLHSSYLGAICANLAMERIEEARGMAARLHAFVRQNCEADDEADPEMQLTERAAALAVSLMNGTATADEIARLQNDYFPQGQEVNGCLQLGLIAIPLLIRKQDASVLPELLRAIRGLAEKTENMFWLETTRRLLDDHNHGKEIEQ